MNACKRYEQIQSELGTDELATALLVLAEAVGKYDAEDLGHNICMGIRKGLFGFHASDHASIESALGQVADAISEKSCD